MPKNSHCFAKGNMSDYKQFCMIQKEYATGNGKNNHPENKLPEQGRYNFKHFTNFEKKIIVRKIDIPTIL